MANKENKKKALKYLKKNKPEHFELLAKDVGEFSRFVKSEFRGRE